MEMPEKFHPQTIFKFPIMNGVEPNVSMAQKFFLVACCLINAELLPPPLI